MASLAKAVHLTKRYAAFFKTKLTDDDLYRWLIINKPCSQSLLKHCHSERNEVKSRNPFKKQDYGKLKIARRVSSFLSRLPTIKLVAATGSLAINNAKKNDDIDLMIITSPNTLWLTRLFVVPLISLFFKRRHPHTPGVCEADSPGVCFTDTICLNLWLDESALPVPTNKRNLYTAHEVLQALPLFDMGNTYAKFIRSNSWTSKYLANAYAFAKSNSPTTKPAHRVWANAFTQCVSFLNILAYKIQHLYMKSKITHETITLHSAYFHPRSLAADLEKYLQKE